MTKTSMPAVPEPAGPTAANLIDWWQQRADISPTGTEDGYVSVCREVLYATAGDVDLTDIDIQALDVEHLLDEFAATAWATLAPATQRAYTNRFRRGVADFLQSVNRHIALTSFRRAQLFRFA